MTVSLQNLISKASRQLGAPRKTYQLSSTGKRAQKDGRRAKLLARLSAVPDMVTEEEYERLRLNAANCTRRAILCGELLPISADTDCVDCGDRADRYDHRDYRNPLDVVPVCRSCNHKRGRALPNHPRPHQQPISALWTDSENADVLYQADCGLAIDFDFSAHEQHIEYMRWFHGLDPELTIAKIVLGEISNERKKLFRHPA